MCHKGQRPPPTPDKLTAPGFLLPSPKVESVEITTPIPEGIPKVGASSLQQTTSAAISSHPPPPNIQEEVVEVADSKDEFEIFNLALSPEISNPDLGPLFSPIIDEMGIQRKPKSSLFDLIEFQLGRDAPGKAAQTKLPTPSQTRLPTPPLALPSQVAELKRKKESKGKEVMGAGQILPPHEDEVQRASKQAKTGQRGTRGLPRREVIPRLGIQPISLPQC